MEQRSIETLAIAQALYSAAGEMVSTKDPDNLRGQADDHYKGLYAMTGAKSFDVRIGDEKVGTFSLTVSKPTESVETEEFETYSREELGAWDLGDPAIVRAYIGYRMDEYARFYFESTGELPPGCRIIKVVHPGDAGGEVTRTALRIDRAAVESALGNRLGAATAALLEGGA